MSDVILELKHLKQYFPAGKGKDGKPLYVKAVDDVSLEIHQGVAETETAATVRDLREYDPTAHPRHSWVQSLNNS